MDALIFELRLALRTLARSRGLTLSAAFALALGIGATTTLFSIVHGATQELPFEDPQELVAVTKTDARRGWTNLPSRAFDYRAWSSARSFEGLAAFTTMSLNIAGNGSEPERRAGALIEPRAFALLGVRPQHGRLFNAADVEPGASAILISYELWQARYAGAAMIGQDIRINGALHTVVGIMPPGFGFPINQDIWLPLQPSVTAGPGAGDSYTVMGRLRAGVTLESARGEIGVIATRLARAHPETHEGRSADVIPITHLEMDPAVIPVLYIMLLAVSFVLVIACANVANLLMARAAARSREIAVRTALGASRQRVTVQQLLESLLVAVLGGVGGLAITYLAVGFFDRSTQQILEAFWVDFRVDRTVLAFTTVTIAAAGILAGLLPALRAARTAPAAVLKDSMPSSLRMGRTSRALIVGELALACALLVVSGILVKAAIALRATTLPFAAEHIYTAQIGVQADNDDVAPRNALLRDLTGQIQSIPGVQAAALVDVLPGRGGIGWQFSLDDAAVRPEDRSSSVVALVTPGFLDVLEARVLRGRTLDWRDGAGAPRVALVNTSWVKRYSPDREALGRMVHFTGMDPVTIVGVVPDLQMQDPEERNADGMYLPLLQNDVHQVRVLASTTGEVLRLTPQLRRKLAAVDPDLPLFEIATLKQAIYADSAVLDAFGSLFALFGAGALILTMVGLYGVVSFGVTQRTRELGIRMSLGAQRSDIARLVLKQGGIPIALGASIGLFLGFVLATGLSTALEWVPAADPLVFSAVLAALGVTGLGALLLPARRAAALDPQRALRFE